MKYLIGAACIAVIAASGAFIFKPMYDDYTAMAASTKLHNEARSALYAYAGAEPNDYDKVLMTCRLANKNPELFTDHKADKVVSTCRFVGIPTTY